MNFDTEKFIIEIQNRPAIWNTKSTEYSERNLRQKAWEELVQIYGTDLPQDKKKQLGLDLQKRWRNIRDAFVKAHKAKESKSGSAAKKKVPYVFYDNLLFIKDTVTVNRTDGNATGNDDENTSIQTEVNVPSMSSLPPKRRKKNNDDNEVGAQLVGVLSKNLERKNMDDDDDRLFFLSLVKEFKKIPEHMQMQTKLDILKVIKDAQQFCDYSNASWIIQEIILTLILCNHWTLDDHLLKILRYNRHYQLTVTSLRTVNTRLILNFLILLMILRMI
ncbi:uncharacterized protein LOC126778260 [Nymphalis io]|uniref:uncharacterized protein LOC126778260 n=1 Tax=Inachis io TaxID=171585 RepID=UPI0021677F69|nr:uncharacterized protein LOC126778260 [Nymphalis io]